MPSNPQDCIEMKVDVGILKTQVSTLTTLCNKMDTVIDKLVERQDRIIGDIYDDINDKKQQTMADIKELHSRITTVDRNLSDKIELTERRIMDRIDTLQKTISDHNEKEDSDLRKILEWKWMVVGAIVIVAWLVSNVNLNFLAKMFN